MVKSDTWNFFPLLFPFLLVLLQPFWIPCVSCVRAVAFMKVHFENFLEQKGKMVDYTEVRGGDNDRRCLSLSILFYFWKETKHI